MHGTGLWCADCDRFCKWLGKARTPEQQAERQANKQIYIRERMAGQEPTKPQLEYLDKLRYRGFVGSRLHASNLINERVDHHEHV